MHPSISTSGGKNTVVIGTKGLDYLMIEYAAGVQRLSLLIIPLYISPELMRLG
jgi:hypothetical protein